MRVDLRKADVAGCDFEGIRSPSADFPLNPGRGILGWITKYRFVLMIAPCQFPVAILVAGIRTWIFSLLPLECHRLRLNIPHSAPTTEPPSFRHPDLALCDSSRRGRTSRRLRPLPRCLRHRPSAPQIPLPLRHLLHPLRRFLLPQFSPTTRSRPELIPSRRLHQLRRAPESIRAIPATRSPLFLAD